MRIALTLSAVLALASCRNCDPDVVTVPDPDIQVDVFPQKGAARVDILWVVDNSGSMGAEQDKVAARFSDFFRQLLISGVDYHIGVVTTDPRDDGHLEQYAGAAVEGCSACRFVTRDVPCANPDVDISGLDDEADVVRLLADECPAQLVFRDLIRVGVDGASFEEGFTQAQQALGVVTVDPNTGEPVVQVPDENDGFLRDDASLYVVFVSDEEEGANGQVRYFQRLFEGLKARGDENTVAAAAITGWPLENAPAPLEEVCAILSTTFDNNPGNDDPRAALVEEQLRSPDVACRDVEAEADDELATARVGGRYVELACRTGGVVANLCDADYSTALDALGANAAGLLRKFTISQPERFDTGTTCDPFDGDGQNLDCDGDGREDGEADAMLCVEAQCLGEDAPSLQPHGTVWELEAGANVRFSGSCLPAPGTDVVVRYRLKSIDQPCE